MNRSWIKLSFVAIGLLALVMLASCARPGPVSPAPPLEPKAAPTPRVVSTGSREMSRSGGFAIYNLKAGQRVKFTVTALNGSNTIVVEAPGGVSTRIDVHGDETESFEFVVKEDGNAIVQFYGSRARVQWIVHER